MAKENPGSRGNLRNAEIIFYAGPRRFREAPEMGKKHQFLHRDLKMISTIFQKF